jgi:hypothetical protein
MSWIKVFMVTVAVALAFSVHGALAQQPQHQDDATKQPAAPSAKPATAAPGMDAHMTQHMEMCRQMMAQGGMMAGGMEPGMTGGGMMGGMMVSGDPKQQAEMMAMRGEMMKAMGDIMMKYAQRMQSAK